MKFNNVSIYYETPFHGITQRASPRRDKSVGRWLTRYRPRLFSHLETGQPAQPVGIDTETIRRAADEDLNAEEKPSVSEPISCFERKRCTVACWRLLQLLLAYLPIFFFSRRFFERKQTFFETYFFFKWLIGL